MIPSKIHVTYQKISKSKIIIKNYIWHIKLKTNLNFKNYLLTLVF